MTTQEKAKGSSLGKGTAQMSFFDIFRSSLTAPSQFFKDIREEKGVLEAWKYYALLMLLVYSITYIVSIPSTLLALLFETGETSVFHIGISLVYLAVIAVSFFIMYLLVIALIFISSALFHLFVMLVGGKQPYYQTFKANCYSSAPLLVAAPFSFLEIVPLFGTAISVIISFLAYVFAAIIFVIGISILHRISLLRAAIAAVIIPFMLMLLFVGLLVIVGFLFSLSSLDSITGHVTSNIF